MHKKASNEDKVRLYFERNRGMEFTLNEVKVAVELSKSEADRILRDMHHDGILIRRKEDLKKENLEKKKGNPYYYQLNPDHKMKETVEIPILSESERLALNLLLHSYTGHFVLGPALESLEKKFQKAGLLTFCSESIGCMASTNRQGILHEKGACNIDTILSAVESQTIIEIEYNTPNTPKAESILLYPIGIFLRDDNIYLYAYRPDKKIASDYSFTRISYIDYLDDEHFTKPEDCMSLKEYISDPFGVKMDPPDKVVVRVIDTQAYYEREKVWPEGTKQEILEDGSVRLTFQVCDSWQFMRWVLAMGSYAIIEEPYDYEKWAYWEHRSGAAPYEEKYGREKLEEPNEPV